LKKSFRFGQATEFMQAEVVEADAGRLMRIHGFAREM